MSQTHIEALVRALGFDPEGTHRQIGVDDDLPIEYPLVVYRMPGYCLTAVTPDLEEALDLLWEQPEERGPVELLQPLLEHVDLQADGAQLLHVTQQTLRPCPAPEGGVCRMLSQADDEALEQFLDALTIPERVAGALDWTEGPCMGLFQDGRLWSAASLRDFGEGLLDVTVSTHPEARGRGLGRAVVAALCRDALEEGRLVQYRHDNTNPASAALAAAVGFTPLATVEGVILRFGED